jgi:predicted  nucleic acid-binding Zn-ribbon protein
MADFETQIKESQAQVAEAQAKISAITSRIEEARSKLDQGVTLDVENATLEDVHKHTDLMNANIAELIMGLDDVTAGFSAEFAEMRTKTGMESFIGIFSSAKAESMRQERMRSASVDDKLQDLISKSDVIVKLLQGQLDLLNGQKTKVENNLAGTLVEREETVGALEAVRTEVAGMDPKIIELENRISVEQDAAARTKLETELATLNAKYNALVQDEQVKLAKSQTLERYIEKGKTWVDSLQNQAATQLVLINKLQTDTKQRVVLYDALTSSLKTAQQQDVAHRINEIGVKTDQEAQTAMAAIGAATNDKMADMLEAHEGHMVFARAILEQKAKADERFARRFAAIVEKHDKNAYGEMRFRRWTGPPSGHGNQRRFRCCCFSGFAVRAWHFWDSAWKHL